MDEDKITGNFDFAIRELIGRLVRAKDIPEIAHFAADVLYDWDKNRGNDWFTGTKLIEEWENRE